MASTDAKPVPQKNVAYRVTFPIFDADGDLVTGAAGLDSEVSKDAGTFADCTNEATEIATSSGMYYLDLTSTEMNADCVAIIVKTSTSGAKTAAIVLYPEETGDIRVQVSDMAAAVLTAAAIATGAIDADALATDAVAEIADGVWDEAISGHQTAATFGREVTVGCGVLLDTTATGTPTGTTLQLTAGSAVDDFYNDQTLHITSGTGIGQARVVLDYVGATKTITVDEAFATTPASGDGVVILSNHVHPVSQIAAAILAAVVDGTNSLAALVRGIAAAAIGKNSGLGTTTATFRDVPDSKDVLVATVDTDGNRSAITYDLT